jgi:hypothetical protein
MPDRWDRRAVDSPSLRVISLDVKPYLTKNLDIKLGEGYVLGLSSPAPEKGRIGL